MKSATSIELTYEQVRSAVMKLTRRQKIKLSRDLEREAIDSRLTALLKGFRTEDLDLKTLQEEVEATRQMIYEEQKAQGNF